MSGLEGKKGYYLQKTGARVNELLERHYIVPTFTTPPTEDTLSWNDNGNIVYFRIGEEVRVVTSNSYDFYRVDDIKENKIVWKKLDVIDDSKYYSKEEIDDKLSNIEIPDIEESLKDVVDELVNINENINDINQESINIKTTINGIQSTVKDIGTELVTKADAETVIDIGNSITEIQHNQYEQSVRVDALGVKMETKASAESVTKIAEELTITNNALASQTTRVDDLGVQMSTKAEASQVTELVTGLDVANKAIAAQEITVNALSSQIETKAERSQVAELGEGLKSVTDSVAAQKIVVNELGAEISSKAAQESVDKLSDSITTIDSALAAQELRVTEAEAQIKTKASKEDVTIIGGAITDVEESLAEQIIRVDDVEASIENKVSKEEFNATTGEIELEFTSVKQTTDGIEETIKTQSGEITSIKENINGITVGIGTLQSDLNSLRNQLDGVTESYFEPYVPSNDNEPAKTWIAQGKQEEHKGDTFTNTAPEGEGAGKSWRWLQDDNGVWSWQPIADTEAAQALALAAQAKAAADGKVTIFYIQPSDYKEGDIWFVHSNDYSPYEKGEILTAINESSAFDLSHWENKTRYTEAIKDLDNVMNTTFKDGVLDEAERISIIESLGSLTNEKSAVDARYNITIVNADFTDAALKNDYKALKSAYDSACDNLIAVVSQIADAKSENLSDLFDDYETASTEYANAYSAYIAKEAEVNEALMGRLNPASKYLDDITNDGVLTPIEKEQLFEIYRSISKEYDATRSNAYTYKVWKYNADETSEESGLNGSEGRYEKYVAFKAAYANVASVFGSTIWGFSNMKETTTLPEGYSTTLLKGYLDDYYEALGKVTESFSAITAAIEEAQKASAATLQTLTDNLLPEEMSTTIGKGVVLSTIIATRDTEGNITAGMNASSVHSDKSDKNHGRVVFVGGAKQLDDFNDAAFVVYEDGHVKMNSAEIAKYASTGDLALGLAGKADNEKVEALRTLVESFSKLWKLQDGVLVTDYDVLTKGQFAAGKVGTEGEGGGGFAYLADLYDVALSSLVSGDLLAWNGNEWVNINQSAIKPDLSSYAKKTDVTNALIPFAKTSDVEDKLKSYATTASLDTVSGRVKTLEDAGFAVASEVNETINGINEALSRGLSDRYTKEEADNILATWNGSENINTLGTIDKGTWKGSKIANDYLANPNIKIIDTTVDLGGEITKEQLRTSLGIDAIIDWYNRVGVAFDKDENGIYVVNGDLITLGQFAAKVAGEEGTGGGGFAYLSDLYDVSLASLASGDLLTWNGSEWVNIRQSSLKPDLSNYATKGYVTDALKPYAKVTDIPSLEGYATEKFVTDKGYATEKFVTDKGYATEGFVTGQGYAKTTEVNETLKSYATNDSLSGVSSRVTSLENAGYTTKKYVDDTFATKDTVSGVDSRVSSIEKYFSTSEDDGNYIDKWNEIVDFLDATEGTTLEGILSVYATNDDLTAGLNDRYTKKNVDDLFSTFKGTANITTLGTITSGVWNGSKIDNAYLANSKVKISGVDVSLGAEITQAALRTGLGLDDLIAWYNKVGVAFGKNADGTYFVDGDFLTNGQFAAAKAGTAGSGGGVMLLTTWPTTSGDYSGYALGGNLGVELNTRVRTLEGKTITWSEINGKPNFASVATSGSYNDLSNKPTIPSEVTESTVSGWGFTKNTGTYSKPSGGIPKSDLASAVQTSLGKADSSVQPNDISEFITIEDVAVVATSGSYNDLVDKPTIPSEVTEDTVSGWGFTKNIGTITGIKMNGVSKGNSGVIDLGNVITAHQDISGKVSRGELAPVAFSGEYGELDGIPSSLPASDVYAWAKEANKPSYSWSEIDGTPTALSQFTNDLGLGDLAYRNDIDEELVEKALGFSPFNAASFNKTNIKNTLGISDWALESSKPSYTKSDVGLGNVENKSSATIRSEITSDNVTKALGYTPYNATNPSGFITASALSDYLPLSGGTLNSGASDTPLVVKSTASTTWIKFESGDNASRYFGIGNSNSLLYLNDSGAFSLYHTGNFTPSDYLPLSGGIMSGSITVGATSNTSWMPIVFNRNGNQGFIGSNGSAIEMGDNNGYLQVGKDVLRFVNNGSGNTIYHSGNFNPSDYLHIGGGTINGSLTVTGYIVNRGHFLFALDNDNADWYVTDRNWQHQYAIIHSGNIGSQSVNYATNAGNAATVGGYAPSYGSNSPWGTIPVITYGGWMDVGKSFEFHYDNETGSDYSTVLACTGNYGNIVDLPSASGTLALTSQLADYLPKSGGMMQGGISWSMEASSAWENYYDIGGNRGLRILNTTGTSVDGAPSAYSVGLIVSGYYGFGLAYDASEGKVKFKGVGQPSWKTIAFTDSNVASAQSLVHSNGAVGATVTAGGNVLINTEGLGHSYGKLQVKGYEEWGGIFYTDRSAVMLSHIGGYGTLVTSKNHNLGTYVFRVNYNDSFLTGSGNTALDVRDNGNVLIGTTSDNGAKLQVVSSSANTLSLYRTTGGGGSFIDYHANNDTSNQWRVGHNYGNAGSSFVFNKFNGATESTLMSLLDNGNVGIGTSNPEWTLDVLGNASATVFRLRDYSTAGLFPNYYITSNGYSTDLWLYNNERLMIYGSTVELASNVNAHGNMNVNGSITIGGIRIYAENGVLKIDGDLYTSGQFASGTAAN